MALGLTLLGVIYPLKNSVWGRDSANFFSRLISLLYQSVNMDLTLLCGDINVSISSNVDDIAEIDNVPQRINIDNIRNKQG